MLYSVGYLANKRIYFYVRVLSTLGVLLAVYLLWEQATRAPSFCSISSIINCDAIISGAVSQTFGVATPLYGLLGYLVMFVAAGLRARKTLMLVTTGGLAFCAWIAYQEFFLLHVICPLCIACQLIMLAAFCLAFVVWKRRL